MTMYMTSQHKTRLAAGSRVLVIGIALAGLAAPTRAAVRLPKVFGDHMVLQRDIPVPVWGWADPGEAITIRFAGVSTPAVADNMGKWMLKMPPQKATTDGRELMIAASNTVTFKDVVVGEVWLCGGQSNMDFGLAGALNAEQEIQAAQFPAIRHFRTDFAAPAEPADDCRGGQWQVCSPATAGSFTAVGYFFARRIHQQLGVPVGLVTAAAGGTPVESWTSKAMMRAEPEFSAALKQFDDNLAKVPAAKKDDPGDAFLPSSLYNGMIAPHVPFGIRGVIWYQGEGNERDQPNSYFHKMRGMIQGWRGAWGLGDFPFYFTQIANFRGPCTDPAGNDDVHWATVRQSQLQTLSVKNSGMAVTIDLADPGNPGDIHPKDKQDVGERLALWALAKTYGKANLVYSGPLCNGIKLEGGKIRVGFDSIGSGLMVGHKEGIKPTIDLKDAKLQTFAIAGADRKWHWADAVIDGKSVVVSSPEVAEPVAVRYAYSMNPVGNKLYNKEGLPASPFRTDDW